jgi:hypothetical protein
VSIIAETKNCFSRVSLLHFRVTMKTCSYIVDEVQQRLIGWNIDKLSVAG